MSLVNGAQHGKMCVCGARTRCSKGDSAARSANGGKRVSAAAEWDLSASGDAAAVSLCGLWVHPWRNPLGCLGALVAALQCARTSVLPFASRE